MQGTHFGRILVRDKKLKLVNLGFVLSVLMDRMLLNLGFVLSA